MSSNEGMTQKQQEIADSWIAAFVSATGGRASTPVVVGRKGESVTLSPDEDVVDLTGAGGLLSLGYIPKVMEALASATDIMPTTGPYGRHVHGAQMELVKALQERIEGAKGVQLWASENEAILAAAHAMGATPEKRVLLIGDRQVPLGMDHLYIRASDIGESEAGEMIHNRQVVAVMVSPIDPDTHRLTDDGLIRLAMDAEDHTPIIWDDTVAGGGWLGEMFTAPRWADLVVLGGVFGGVLPLGAVVYRRYAPAYCANRDHLMAGAVASSLYALKVIETVEQAVRMGRANLTSEMLETHFSSLAQQFPRSVDEVVGSGAMRGIVMSSETLAGKVVDTCRKAGFLVGRSTKDQRIVTVAVPILTRADTVSRAGSIIADAIMSGDRSER